MSRSRNKTIEVEALTHKDAKRRNIPTAEFESLMREEDKSPVQLAYQRRNRDLDPQLVWRGKDEQDWSDLIVQAPPLYIQEKVHPKVLIDDLKRESKERAKEKAPPAPDLFGDFNGLHDLEAKTEFYQHDQNWSNRMILGDSLSVMASLAEREGLRGQVQCIYIDPPYGIKFNSNFQWSTTSRDVKDGAKDHITREPEQVRAFRDTWRDGIHSYLTYLRDRLTVARDLLHESGSIFVQIGDENVHRVRVLMDEVFGQENYVSEILVKKKGSQISGALEPVNDFILFYAKNQEKLKFRKLWLVREDEEIFNDFPFAELDTGERVRVSELAERDGKSYLDNYAAFRSAYPEAKLFALNPLKSGGFRRNQSHDFRFHGRVFPIAEGQCWKHTVIADDGMTPGMTRLGFADRLFPLRTDVRFIRYSPEPSIKQMSNWWDGLGGAPNQVYVVQTNAELVKRCLLMSTDPGDLVLDPTCGSGTTAYVAEQWGRRWITIDTSRVALALARTRLMAGRYPYYLLADSPEGAVRQAHQGSGPPRTGPFTGDIRQGFVYRTVAHISSSTIANNPDIQEGMSRAEIDAAIARHAETEVLYDRPYTDPKVVRVSGPFTVESLSPHRMLAADAGDGTRDGATPEVARDEGRFVSEIIDNLRKAGVQNTIKQERLQFDLLEPWPGEYVQARGEYTENGQPRTAAVCIGPEHGTVGQELVQAAAKEAVRMADLLVVCGFAFDAYARQTTHLGRLAILTAQMNPDLMMPELLKKTGAGNLFMVFGEPDIVIHHGADDLLTVEIRGLDVYDPTTGQIRSHSTDDIACWFIDTAYDEESFFVRHAYFLGAGDPYERLRRALRADVDEAAWASLYSATSRPFPRPDTGQIAVKVINHYGDEV